MEFPLTRVHPRPVSQLICSQWRGSVFGGKACALGCASTTFTLLFSPFALVAVCQTSALVVCDVGLLHREEGSAPWGPASVGREEQLGPRVRMLPSSPDAFENRISYFWLLTPDVFKHQIPQTSKIQLQHLVQTKATGHYQTQFWTLLVFADSWAGGFPIQRLRVRQYSAQILQLTHTPSVAHLQRLRPPGRIADTLPHNWQILKRQTHYF